jgi:hypothetical protein
LNEVRKLYPYITFKNFIADGAMDNYTTYRLLHKWNMIPFIPLDSNARIDYVKPHPGILCFDDDGNPICMGGIPYQHVGFPSPRVLNTGAGSITTELRSPAAALTALMEL